ncbi:MAG: hypothetical protein WAQ75_03225, partial [Propionicimonas sp.]
HQRRDSRHAQDRRAARLATGCRQQRWTIEMTTTTHSRRIRTATVRLGLGGAAGFWVTNFAISLTPIAAEYRAARGIAYLPMLGEALLAGLIIGFGVTVCLLRFYGTLPTSSPILKALLLSLVALIVATILVEIPPRLLTATNTPPRYVLIAAAFNTLRFLALGLAIGYLHGRTQKTDPEKPST